MLFPAKTNLSMPTYAHPVGVVRSAQHATRWHADDLSPLDETMVLLDFQYEIFRCEFAAEHQTNRYPVLVALYPANLQHHFPAAVQQCLGKWHHLFVFDLELLRKLCSQKVVSVEFGTRCVDCILCGYLSICSPRCARTFDAESVPGNYLNDLRRIE